MHGLEYLGGPDHGDDDWSHLSGKLAPINNACPRCQWFSPTAEDWPPWNGEVPTVRAPTFSVNTGDNPAEVREAAREAAIAARVAAAAHSIDPIEHIYALFHGEEHIPDEGLSRAAVMRRIMSLEHGFTRDDVAECLHTLVYEHGFLIEHEREIEQSGDIVIKLFYTADYPL